jgi:hypothetical protein
MGQFKQISVYLARDRRGFQCASIHPRSNARSSREQHNTTPHCRHSFPFVEVYVLLCDGDVTDVFTDKAMAEYDLHTCISADLEEGLLHSWSLVTRQLTTTTLR